jgi:hypothetical protein
MTRGLPFHLLILIIPSFFATVLPSLINLSTGTGDCQQAFP